MPFSLGDAQREIERLARNERQLLEALNECRVKLGLPEIQTQVPIRGMHEPG
jgi:hypothetical protein